MDRSDAARHVAAAAKWFAHGLDAPLLIAHVFDPDGIAVPRTRDMATASITNEDIERIARRRARRVVDELALAIGGEVETEVPEDMPVPGLLNLAAARRARLVVAGTAARAGLGRVLIGSVSSEVAARAACAVAAVPLGAALAESGPVVAGYDGSDHSLRAARHAAAIAAQMDRDVVLVHAAGGRGEGVSADDRLSDELFEAAADALRNEPDRRPLDLKLSVAVEEGNPVETLVRVCRERAAPFVVTGTRGRNALSSALLGSVSVGLVRAAGRPVVLVPASAVDTPR